MSQSNRGRSMFAESMWHTVTDLDRQADLIRRGRYGIIEMAAARFVAVHLRPWPKLLALPDLIPVGHHYHRHGPPDHCLLYYNQPRRFPNYLALKYVVSAVGTSLATFRGALTMLDAIAQLKGTDALLCDAMNSRISDRLLARWGWEPHKPQRWHRNYIKRFYGNYPPLELPIDLATQQPAC